MNEKLFYTVALSMIKNIGPVMAKNLLAYCGSAEAVFSASKVKLMKVPDIGESRADDILQSNALKKAETELKFIEKNGIEVIAFTDERYPQRLLQCNDAPFLLYYKGNSPLNTQRVLGIVGTRRATEFGKEVTRKIVQELATLEVLVVSGLAYGIDVTAHNAALEFNLKTIGVLGHGLQTVYPAQNAKTATRMLEQGGLLTEFTSQDEVSPHNFPSRNRIVAGMCDAVLVVETLADGGAAITANIASSYNRDVFAVPGKPTDKQSAGCNYLIKSNKAALVENAKDIIDAMRWNDGDLKPKRIQKQLALDLNPEEKVIFDLLNEHGELEIDRLSATTGISTGNLAGSLLEMEMNGLIMSLPGKRYKLV